ncbi:hypothetical protein FNV43_RR02552 [Rhamnella rubrinervis]|uniref:Uncharacterized protein n=1 Tax=Rhamnella rubrinervis TaxID=2594499 RepID=A0A8K0HRN5_9ROSA|nr:hypothetical protein FNV43_RR02552 [Rhamnella rubrinervis]
MRLSLTLEDGARFDRHTFAIVSGSNCGTLPPIGEMLGLTDRLWNKYFGSIGTISAKDMITKFEKYPFVKSEVDDNVSICMFYLLEIVFLSGSEALSESISGILAWKFPSTVLFETLRTKLFEKEDMHTNGSHDEPSHEELVGDMLKSRRTFPSHPHHISSSPDVAMFDKKLEMIRFEIL